MRMSFGGQERFHFSPLDYAIGMLRISEKQETKGSATVVAQTPKFSPKKHTENTATSQDLGAFFIAR